MTQHTLSTHIFLQAFQSDLWFGFASECLFSSRLFALQPLGKQFKRFHLCGLTFQTQKLGPYLSQIYKPFQAKLPFQFSPKILRFAVLLGSDKSKDSLRATIFNGFCIPMFQLLKGSKTEQLCSYLVMLQTKKTAAELRQKVLIMERKDSWPAVSQICILMLVCQSMRTSREQNYTPRVAVQPSRNQSFVNRFNKQLLPTPGGPIMIILNVFSYYPFISNHKYIANSDYIIHKAQIIIISNTVDTYFTYSIIQMNQNREQENNLPDCAKWLETIPFWTRTLYFGLAGCWFLDLITGLPSALVASSVYNTIEQGRIWTLLTSAFYIDSLFMLSIVLFNFNTFLPKLQQKNSSLVVTLSFLGSNIAIQTATLFVQWLIGYQRPPLNGVMGVWFSMVCQYCYYNQTGAIKFCCFPWKIPKIMYPVALLGVLTLFRFSLPIDLLVGLLFAIFQVKLCAVMPSKRICYQKLAAFTTCIQMKSWIPFGTSRQGGSFDSLNYQNLQNFEEGRLQQKSEANNIFSKKGHRLGDY